MINPYAQTFMIAARTDRIAPMHPRSAKPGQRPRAVPAKTWNAPGWFIAGIKRRASW